MSKTHIGPTTLVAASFACALGLTLLSGPFAALASLGSLVLVLILLSYDQDGYRSWFQSIAFSGVCSFCCAVASGAVLQLLAAQGEVHLANGRWATEWMPIGFLFAIAVFLGIDRARMSSREPVEMRQARLASAPQPGFIPRTAYAAPSQPNIPPAETLHRLIQEEVARAFADQQSGAAQQPSPATPVHAAPLPPETTTPVPPKPFVPTPPSPVPFSTAAQPGVPNTKRFVAPPPEPAPVTSQPPPPEPAATEPARDETGPTLVAHPAATPVVPRGKEATIYVNLVGEGMNVLRSVIAEHLGRDFYRIVEPVPEGETWEFQPGQVVRCKKKNLSGGKALVAIEEAPKAHA